MSNQWENARIQLEGSLQTPRVGFARTLRLLCTALVTQSKQLLHMPGVAQSSWRVLGPRVLAKAQIIQPLLGNKTLQSPSGTGKTHRATCSSIPVPPTQILGLISPPWSLRKELNACPCVRTYSFTCKTPGLPWSLFSPLGRYFLGLDRSWANTALIMPCTTPWASSWVAENVR